MFLLRGFKLSLLNESTFLSNLPKFPSHVPMFTEFSNAPALKHKVVIKTFQMSSLFFQMPPLFIETFHMSTIFLLSLIVFPHFYRNILNVLLSIGGFKLFPLFFNNVLPFFWERDLLGVPTFLSIFYQMCPFFYRDILNVHSFLNYPQFSFQYFHRALIGVFQLPPHFSKMSPLFFYRDRSHVPSFLLNVPTLFYTDISDVPISRLSGG